MRRWTAVALLAVGAFLAPPAPAIPPVPMFEVIDTIRGLTADQLGIKKSEVDLTQSLAAQGMSENGLHSLVIDIQQEFGVVIPDRELTMAKWNDPIRPLSVRRLADLVAEQMHPEQ